MDTIIDAKELAAARGESLADLMREIRVLARRAISPARKQSLAELEAVLLRTREEWTGRGLLTTVPEVAA